MKTGVVVIGRNEGERLHRCFASLGGQAKTVVYVDSGSTDGSVELARGMGIESIELDMATPFNAARARNAGFSSLVDRCPFVQLVQFVDGDCELVAGWLEVAQDILERRPELAAVAGRLKERSPDASIYNRLGEMEWNHLGNGDVGSVGGIFMVRRMAFEDCGGFNPSISAGEEPELCQRLTLAGWVISRVDAEMAWHDLAMTRFGQWWRRQIRGGYGALDVATRFGLPRFRKSVWRARFWSIWPFLVVLAGGMFGWGGALASFSLWLLQFLRIGLRAWQQGQPVRIALAYAFLIMLSFWPQMIGQVQYLFDRASSRGTRLIEYKRADLSGGKGSVPER